MLVALLTLVIAHNNWAVLVCTSRFWFNYRHTANTLSIYHTIKKLGIPDNQIILMLAEDSACNARNTFPGTVYNDGKLSTNLYGDNVEVDYRGYEASVDNFLRVLTGRTKNMPISKQLRTDDQSKILVYLTGHGGNEFLKFQDHEELTSKDLADAFGQMFERKRYKEILFMIDTCQANTMYTDIYSPNILSTGSSAKDENSYSYDNSDEIGTAVIDRWTYSTLKFFENVDIESKATMHDLFMSHDLQFIHSNPGVSSKLMSRQPSQIKVTDFFGSVQNFIPTTRTKKYPSPAKLQKIPNYENQFAEKERQHDLPKDAILFNSWFLDLLNKFL